MDTIETSNLNRQFLFRKHHVGESKAKVAAEAVKRFRPNARIQADQVQYQRWSAHLPTLQHTDVIQTASFAPHMLDVVAIAPMFMHNALRVIIRICVVQFICVVYACLFSRQHLPAFCSQCLWAACQTNHGMQGNVKEPQYDVDFFKSFDLVMNGLDNLEARRHVNRLCLAAETPLIESGTAGYLGQVSFPSVQQPACQAFVSASHAFRNDLPDSCGVLSKLTLKASLRFCCLDQTFVTLMQTQTCLIHTSIACQI